MTEKDIKKSRPNKARRNFLKNTAIAAAGIMIVPRHVLGGNGASFNES